MSWKPLLSLVTAIVVILAAGAGRPPSGASRLDAALQEDGPSERGASPASGWVQVNDSGFGDGRNIGVTALEVFGRQLYAGTANPEQGGRVWRGDGRTSWEPVSEIGFGQGNTNAVVIDLVAFGDRLYASTGWAGARGQVWRTLDGIDWEQVEGNGFGDLDNHSVTALAVYSQTLYAATENTGGAQVWRSATGDTASWTQVVTGGLGSPAVAGVTGLVEFAGALYAAVESRHAQTGAQVWRTADGLAWTAVITDGFGDPNNNSTGGFSQLDDDLYLGTRNDVTGAQIWRSADGTSWTQVVGDGFGDGANVKIEALVEFEGHLYAVTFNGGTGTQVWRSADGTLWRQVNASGFGRSGNYATLWSNATAVFNARLYIGTWNSAEGGHVWATLRHAFLPLLVHDYPPPEGYVYRSQPRFQVFILNPVRTCLVGDDFASGNVCHGLDCGDCNCTWDEFDPPAPLLGVPPSQVNDPPYAGYEHKVCVEITLTQGEVDEIIADVELVRQQVFEWSGGALDLQIEYTVLAHDYAGFVAPDFVFGPFEVDDELLNPYVPVETDFVYVVTGVHDRAQGLHLAFACGGSYGEMTVHGAGYANVQYNDLCNSVTIAGQRVYEPLIHEWMHNLDWALYHVTLVPDLYQHVWPDWEHWDPGSWPACDTGDANTYAWFPSVDYCEWDPDWMDCNNVASAGRCIHAGEVGGDISWYEHVIGAHYPRQVRFIGNYCRDGRRNFSETGVDEGWPCP